MYYVALAVIIIVFIWRIRAGFRRGLVQEIVSLIAMAAAGICAVLMVGAIGSYLDKEISKTIEMAAVLFAVCIVYRIVHVLFTSLKLISKLPLIKGLDKLLGAAAGALEAGVIVAVLVHFLKNWGLTFLALG